MLSFYPRPARLCTGVLPLTLVFLLAGMLPTSPAQAGANYDLAFVPPTPLPPNVAEGAMVSVTVELQGGCDPFSPISWNADAVAGPFGSATLGVDFSAASPALLMFDGPGGRFATTTITIFDDMDVEGPETFDLKLTPNGSAGLTCGAAPNLPEYILTLTIIDDDTGAAPTIEIDDVQVTEGDSGDTFASFSVTLVDSPGTTVSVDFETIDGSATVADGDYASTSGQLFFTGTSTRGPAGDVQIVSVLVNGDTVFEGDEVFKVHLSNAFGATISDDEGVGTIVNDDPAPTTPTLQISDVTVIEGDNGTVDAVFAVTLMDPPAASVVTVDYATLDGSADAASGDYVPATGQLIFSGGAERGLLVEHVTVTIAGDTLVEPDETFFVELSNAMSATITDDTGEGTIVNDDAPAGDPAISITDVVVAEGDTGNVQATVIVELDQSSNDTIVVQYATRDGSATEGEDYLPASGSVSIPPGDTKVELDLFVFGDIQPEANELFFVDLSNPDGGVLADDEGRVFIQDDDPAALPELTIDDVAVVEGDTGTTEAVFVVSISPPSADAVSVSYATEDGTALGGNEPQADYLPRNGRLTISVGETSREIRVPVRPDTTPEPDETFLLNLSEPSGATLARDQATATIVNDDEAPLPIVSIGDAEVIEGNEGTTEASLTLTLTEASATPVSVRFKTDDGSASANDGDYQSSGGTATFGAGALETTITIPVVGDTEDEEDETFFVSLDDPNGALLGDAKGMVTIIDDDDTLPTLSINDITVAEGNAGTATAALTVRLSTPSETDVQVAVATRDGTATAGEDYQATETVVTIAAGDQTASFTVNVRGDTTPESDETFFADLSNAQGAKIADGEGRATIVDDDDEATPLPRLAIRDAVVQEGDSGRSAAIFRVRLVPASTSPVEVTFRTVNGTATAGEDYLARTDVLRFAPGQTEAAFNIAIIGDTRTEGNENFRVALIEPAGATLVNRFGTGRIIDDDADLGTIRLVSAAPVVEQDGRGMVVVRREGDARLPAQVTVSATAGSARAGDDFNPVTRVLRWAAGDSGDRTVPVRVRNDREPEGEETIAIRLSDPVGARLGSPSALDMVIVDDDTAARLEAVSDQQSTVRVRQERALVVRAVDVAGAVVPGAMVRWQVAGDATLLGDEDQQTNAEGLSRQPVRMGRIPGEVTVTAELLGGDSAIAFVLTVEGNLTDLVDPEANPNDAGLAAVLDASCAQATGELAGACAYIFGLENDAERRQVLGALRPNNATATANRGLRTPEIQIRNLSERLRILRGATGTIGRLHLDQISVNLRGEGLTVGTLRQAATTPNAERILADRVDAALAKARGDRSTLVAPSAPNSENTIARGGAASADGATSTGGDGPFETGASRWGLFLTGRITIGDAPNTRREAGYDFETEGVTAGVDYRIGDRFVLGAAVGYLRSEADVERNLGGADVSGYSLSIYGSYYRERFYVDGMLSQGANQYDLTRAIILPRPFQGSRQRVATADPDGSQIAANLGLGYEMRLGQATALEGFARVGYTRAEVDAYREVGAGPFNLTVDDQELESVLSEAGFELTRPFSVRWGVLQPSLRVAYLHEFADDARLIRVRFGADQQGRRFTLRTDAPDRDFFNLGAALTATLPRGWATFLQYDTDLARDDLNVYTVTGGVRKQLR